MPLKALVKVGSITNLSDARYCAGMGVDWLGFNVVEGHERYISPKQFQDIRGWISGPKIVAQIYGIPSAAALAEVMEAYRPDLLELGMAELAKFPTPQIPFILSVTSPDALKDLKGVTPEYIQVDTLGEDYHGDASLIVSVHSVEDASKMIERPDVKGISLHGGQEIRPGLKEYDELADILEMLETDS